MTLTSKNYLTSPKQLSFSLMQSIKKSLPYGSGVKIEDMTGLNTVRISEAFRNTYPLGYKDWQLKIANAGLTLLEDAGVNVKRIVKLHANQLQSA